jgi:uncharacterized phage protein (TIGR01671 family)
MGREIKFRAWHRLTLEMINVYVLDQTGDAGTGRNAHLSKGYNDDGQKEFYLHDTILMQYTGLKDKNEKEIYEGDICKYELSSEGEILTDGIGVVEYNEWAFFVGDYPVNEATEVIGNIYENSEMIKVKPK